MKKFEELRRCLEKYSEVNLVNIDGNGLVTEGAWFEPSLILDLLADREQLREALRFVQQNPIITKLQENPSASKLHYFSCVNEALKKSDEVEKIKEIVEV